AEARERARMQIMKLPTETAGAIQTKVLKLDQARRLRQIALQAKGPGAFLRDDVKAALKHTAEEGKEVGQGGDAAGGRTRGGRGGGGGGRGERVEQDRGQEGEEPHRSDADPIRHAPETRTRGCPSLPGRGGSARSDWRPQEPRAPDRSRF